MKTVQTNIRFILQILIFTLSLSVCQVNAVEVSQSLNPANSIAFEETAQFEIEISWDGPQSKYFFPKPLRPQFERLTAGELTSSISSIGTGPDEITTKRYKYTLIPSLSGLGRIESINIEYINRFDSLPGILVTEPMTITIANPKPVVRSDTKSGFGMWLIIIGLAVLIGGGGLYYVLVIKSKASKNKEVNPEQELLTNLDSLQKEASNDLKKFQTGVYKLLTVYLSQRYQINSELGNVSEVVEQLKSTTLPIDQQETISNWFLRAEKEKFSPAASAPGATMRLYSEIKQFFESKIVK